MQAGAWAKIRRRLRYYDVIGRTTANMSNPQANTITDCTVQINPNQYVPDITEIIVQANCYSGHPIEIRHAADIFDGQRIVNVITILCVGSNSRSRIALKQV